MRTWNKYTTVTRMVTDYDQDGHMVGAHEEPVNSDSKDKPVPARRVDRLLATRSLPAPRLCPEFRRTQGSVTGNCGVLMRHGRIRPLGSCGRWADAVVLPRDRVPPGSFLPPPPDDPLPDGQDRGGGGVTPPPPPPPDMRARIRRFVKPSDRDAARSGSGSSGRGGSSRHWAGTPEGPWSQQPASIACCYPPIYGRCTRRYRVSAGCAVWRQCSSIPSSGPAAGGGAAIHPGCGTPVRRPRAGAPGGQSAGLFGRAGAGGALQHVDPFHLGEHRQQRDAGRHLVVIWVVRFRDQGPVGRHFWSTSLLVTPGSPAVR